VKTSRRQFLVTLDVPKGVKVGEMAAFIRDAVGTMAKSEDPGGALFALDAGGVKVKAVSQPKSATK